MTNVLDKKEREFLEKFVDDEFCSEGEYVFGHIICDCNESCLIFEDNELLLLRVDNKNGIDFLTNDEEYGLYLRLKQKYESKK